MTLANGKTVKGFNLLNALYHSGEVSIPVAFEVIHKPTQFCDSKTRQLKRASEVTKNELLREIITTCVKNVLKFRYVLMDSWFAAEVLLVRRVFTNKDGSTAPLNLVCSDLSCNGEHVVFCLAS